MDSKAIAIVVVAIIAAAGWGVAGYSMISQPDQGSHNSEPTNTVPSYGAGYEMKATAKWIDGESTLHTGNYTFTTLSMTNTSLIVKVIYKEGSDSYESTISVSKIDETHYTSTVGVIGMMNAEYDGSEHVWKIGSVILSRSQDDNILYRLYEVSASAYLPLYGEYKLNPANLFNSEDTLAHTVALNQRATNGLYYQGVIVKIDGTYSRYNIVIGDNVIRSNDSSILTDSTIPSGIVVVYDNMVVSGQSKDYFDVYCEDYSSESNNFLHRCYCDNGTLLCKIFTVNTDTNTTTDWVTIDSLTRI